MRTAPPFPLRTRTTAEPEPDLISMVVTHRAIRQDMRRLDTCLRAAAHDGLTAARADAVGGYTAALLAQIRAHLDSEDEFLWPVIAATAGQSVDLAPLTDDHSAIEAAVVKVSRALAATDKARGGLGELSALVTRLRKLLEDHIADEEAQVFPAMRRYLTAGAFLWCGKQIWRTAALRDRVFAVPWLARHATQEELRRLLAPGGWPAWLLLAAGRPGYARLERQAFGPPPAPAAASSRQVRGQSADQAGDITNRTARRTIMSRLNVMAEQDAQATPEIVWELVSDATRFPQWGPWIAAGYRRPGDTSPRGPGAIQWLRSSRRVFLRHVTMVEKILEAEQDRRLVYTVLGGLPVHNYLGEVTLTPIADGTHIRWAGSWDNTLPGRIVHRGLREAFPQIVGDLVTAAEKQRQAGG